MLHAKFQDPRPLGSDRRRFLYIHIVVLEPLMLHAKFL